MANGVHMINLYEVMKSVNGATFISICTSTDPPLLLGNKNPMKGRVRKHVKDSSVMVFQNKRINGYEAMVHRRLVQEGKDPKSFILSNRQWGQRIINTPFVEHKGKFYLEVIFLRCGEIIYTLDGSIIDPSEIIGLKPKAEEGEQGGLDNKVIIRTYALQSINSITINKKHL